MKEISLYYIERRKSFHYYFNIYLHPANPETSSLTVTVANGVSKITLTTPYEQRDETSNFSSCKLHMARDSMPEGPHAKHVAV